MLSTEKKDEQVISDKEGNAGAWGREEDIYTKYEQERSKREAARYGAMKKKSNKSIQKEKQSKSRKLLHVQVGRKQCASFQYKQE